MSDTDEALRVYRDINEYCETYKIPRENLLDILEDQKVLPMIRGKATEFVGVEVVRQTLDPRDWLVEKLNLNPQRDSGDEDMRITFKRTGTQLRAETKNAVRDSFRLGTPRHKVKVPHFKVKCHKSRGNTKRKTNDRYLVGDFDLLLCNVSNAIIREKILDRGLPLIQDSNALNWLAGYYGTTNADELRSATYDDWRACMPATIAQSDKTLPRTPEVQMINDPHWFGLDRLAAELRTLINGGSSP